MLQGISARARSLSARWIRTLVPLTAAALLWVGPGATLVRAAWDGPEVSAEIRRLLSPGRETAAEPAREIQSPIDVALRFYENRDFHPAWTGQSGLLPAADALRSAVQDAASHGLCPDDYHLEGIWGAGQEPGPRGDSSSGALARRDVRLTQAFLTLAGHLRGGRFDSAEGEPEWATPPGQADLAWVLEQALATDRVHETLAGLAPAEAGYQFLRQALARYRAIASSGGWETLGETPTLHLGDRSPNVSVLRRRLFAEGYLPAQDGPEVVDEAVELAVREYQTRTGLDADGVVGRATRASLDVSAAARVAQIEANLERLRRRGEVPAGRHLRVNTAAFRLEAVEQGRVALRMAVVVGTPENPTPVFTGQMTHLVLNPSWNVPPQIAREEFLPELRRDSLHFARKGFQVLRGWNPEVVVDPASVDWGAASVEREGLHFRQGPGPQNALGRLKFLFPNRFHVYLHDTPARALFGKARRDFSHGCIRVAEPEKLAAYLLAPDPRWTPEAFQGALAAGEERSVVLREPVPVRIEYFTAWADEAGVAHFRTDIYGRDARTHVSSLAMTPDT